MLHRLIRFAARCPCLTAMLAWLLAVLANSD